MKYNTSAARTVTAIATERARAACSMISPPSAELFVWTLVLRASKHHTALLGDSRHGEIVYRGVVPYLCCGLPGRWRREGSPERPSSAFCRTAYDYDQSPTARVVRHASGQAKFDLTGQVMLHRFLALLLAVVVAETLVAVATAQVSRVSLRRPDSASRAFRMAQHLSSSVVGARPR